MEAAFLQVLRILWKMTHLSLQNRSKMEVSEVGWPRIFQVANSRVCIMEIKINGWSSIILGQEQILLRWFFVLQYRNIQAYIDRLFSFTRVLETTFDRFENILHIFYEISKFNFWPNWTKILKKLSFASQRGLRLQIDIVFKVLTKKSWEE